MGRQVHVYASAKTTGTPGAILRPVSYVKEHLGKLQTEKEKDWVITPARQFWAAMHHLHVVFLNSSELWTQHGSNN